MGSIILLTIVGVIISVVVGSLWYSPLTPMGRLHMRYVGFDKLSPEEQKLKMLEAKPEMPKKYLAQMILSAMTAVAVVFIVTMSMQNGVEFVAALSLVAVNWLCFMVPVIGSQLLWDNLEKGLAWPKFFSDIMSNLVTVVLVAILAGLFA
jgi:hypothetical protein